MSYSVKTSSTNFQNKAHLNEFCGITRTLEVLGSRWKVNIIAFLMHRDVLRYAELKKLLPGISERILWAKLKGLEKDGIIRRTVFPEVPPRVEYRLTELGRSLERLLEMMDRWGESILLGE